MGMEVRVKEEIMGNGNNDRQIMVRNREEGA